MNALIILNDPPYGTERSYNGARRGTLDQLTEWTVWANQVLTF